MKYKVNWDNGANACGTFQETFDTEQDAQDFGENWVVEMTAVTEPDPDWEGYSFEVIEVEDESDTEGEGWDENAELRQAALNCGRP